MLATWNRDCYAFKMNTIRPNPEDFMNDLVRLSENHDLRAAVQENEIQRKKNLFKNLHSILANQEGAPIELSHAGPMGGDGFDWTKANCRRYESSEGSLDLLIAHFNTVPTQGQFVALDTISFCMLLCGSLRTTLFEVTEQGSFNSTNIDIATAEMLSEVFIGLEPGNSGIPG